MARNIAGRILVSLGKADAIPFMGASDILVVEL
jgi:hypothetical protein